VQAFKVNDDLICIGEMQVNFTSGPMPFSQGVMTLVPTQQAQQPVGGTPSQSAGPAAGPPHHMMITQPAAQQHSLHTVPQQMIMPSQPQAGIQPPPVGAHQYVQAHPMPGNLLFAFGELIWS